MPRRRSWAGARPTLTWTNNASRTDAGTLQFGVPDLDGLIPLRFRPDAPKGMDGDEIGRLRRECERGSRDWWWYAAMHPMGGSRIARVGDVGRGKIAIAEALASDGMTPASVLLTRGGYVRDPEGASFRRPSSGGATTIAIARESVTVRRKVGDVTTIRAILQLSDHLGSTTGIPVFWPGPLGKIGRLVEMALAYEGDL